MRSEVVDFSIFLIQPKDYRRYISVIYKFLYTKWRKVFYEEFINGKNPADERMGETLKIELKDRTLMMISAQIDGGVEIKYSDNPGVLYKLDADYLARLIGR